MPHPVRFCCQDLCASSLRKGQCTSFCYNTRCHPLCFCITGYFLAFQVDSPLFDNGTNRKTTVNSRMLFVSWLLIECEVTLEQSPGKEQKIVLCKEHWTKVDNSQHLLSQFNLVLSSGPDFRCLRLAESFHIATAVITYVTCHTQPLHLPFVANGTEYVCSLMRSHFQITIETALGDLCFSASKLATHWAIWCKNYKYLNANNQNFLNSDGILSGKVAL